MNAFMISLDDEGKVRRDEFEKWERELYKHDIQTKYFITKYHPVSGNHGNFMSYWQVIHKAYEQGLPYALFFEDDVKPTVHMDMAKVKSTVRQLEIDYPTWECLYLGYYNLSVLSNIYPNVVEALCVATHAIVISRRGMSRLISELPRYWRTPEPISPIDIAIIEILRQHRHVSFAMIPMMFVQSGHITKTNQFDQTVIDHYNQKLKESEILYSNNTK